MFPIKTESLIADTFIKIKMCSHFLLLKDAMQGNTFKAYRVLDAYLEIFPTEKMPNNCPEGFNKLKCHLRLIINVHEVVNTKIAFVWLVNNFNCCSFMEEERLPLKSNKSGFKFWFYHLQFKDL